MPRSDVPPGPYPAPPGGDPGGYQTSGQPPYAAGPYRPWPYRPPRASFLQRLAALLIDGLVASLGLFVLVIPLVVFGVLLSSTEEQVCRDASTGLASTCTVPTAATVALWLALALAMFAGYLFVIFLVYIRPVARTGQSIGRRLLGIRVVDQDTGQPISLGRAFGRYLFASFVSGILYIGYLWMLWDDNGQTLHDKVVRSVVVPANP